MKKIRKIMVACDFSEYSKQALEYAAELAETLRADLIVTHVINQRDIDAIQQATLFSPSISLDEFLKRQTENRSRQIDKLIEETIASRLPVKKIIKTGVPFDQIIRAAADEGADLVVMGPKGRGNLSGILFGTTAEKLARHCPVPLLSVRGDRHGRE
jgi:nucleotide-binding universal stress UspA family protein